MGETKDTIHVSIGLLGIFRCFSHNTVFTVLTLV
jgi:hypothetical protein